MTTDEIKLLASRIENDLLSGKFAGIVLIAFGKTGEVEYQYTDYVSRHPAQTVGYLNVLCQEITDKMRKI